MSLIDSEGSPAALSPPVFVSLSSSVHPELMASQRRRRSSAATADALGLVESTSYLRLFALFLHALLTVAYLVWINASGPFLLSTLESLPEDSIGSATSRLLLADEATALALYLPVGTLSDSPKWGLRRNAVAAYGLVAAALVAYVRAPTLAWLIAVRVVFAVRPLRLERPTSYLPPNDVR